MELVKVLLASSFIRFIVLFNAQLALLPELVVDTELRRVDEVGEPTGGELNRILLNQICI